MQGHGRHRGGGRLVGCRARAYPPIQPMAGESNGLPFPLTTPFELSMIPTRAKPAFKGSYSDAIMALGMDGRQQPVGAIPHLSAAP
jgi:hypothetical protein